jgi:hypothetical protein
MAVAIVRLAAAEFANPVWQQRLPDALDERAAAIVVVDGPLHDWLAVDRADVRAIPAVTLAVVRDANPEQAPATAGCDLSARGTDDSQVEAWVEDVAERVNNSPLAVTALARTLRITEEMSVADGLVVESLAYSVLQAGPEHQRWLAQRGSRKPNATR